MPLIEELPVTAPVKASAGWAYVPDTAPLPSQAPSNRNDRKRAAASTTRYGVNTTAKREKAIERRLESLNKENYKDGVHVPIPSSNRERDKGRKVTSNVRRILGYQRNFAHYLADEEGRNPGATHYALPAVATGTMAPPEKMATMQKSTSKDLGRRKSGRGRDVTADEGSAPDAPQPQSRGSKRRQSVKSRVSISEANSSPASAGTPVAQKTTTPQVKTEESQSEYPQSQDISMMDAASILEPTTVPQAQPDYPPAWDDDPLLRSSTYDVPPMPTDRVMQLLVSEPPLTYNAARATQLDEDKRPPPRHFCAICGYWGRVKCKKCGEFTCGTMECWKAHEVLSRLLVYLIHSSYKIVLLLVTSFAKHTRKQGLRLLDLQLPNAGLPRRADVL
ncbi:hypothetical protein LTS08_003500 [Lithohypha guttulata]|nr:hypothetical protein LTS08_003500 [Lithohypha guttulata]